MSNLNVNNISDESGVGNNLILAADGTTTIPGGTNRPQIAGCQIGTYPGEIGYQAGPKTVNGITIESGFYSAMSESWLSTPGRSGAFWQRVGQLVTVSIDYGAGVDWGIYNSSSFAGKDYALAFSLPYMSGAPTPSTTNLISKPFINPTSTWRAWTTSFPVNDNTATQGPMNMIQRDSDACRFVKVVDGASDNPVTWEDFRDNATGTAGLEFQIFMSYFTDDTTWQPLNGATVA